MVHQITRNDSNPMDEWQPSDEYRLARDVWGLIVLQRKYYKVEWPHEPYREKGEEIIHEKWENVPEGKYEKHT